MANQQWIAYVGPFLFPWGQPGSRRVYGMARSLAELGYQVVVGSGESEPHEPTLLENTDGSGSISFVGLNELPADGVSLSAKLLQLFWHQGARTVAWLNAQPVPPAYVVLYGGYAPFMFHLLPWCKKNCVPLLVDVVEWYSGSHMSGGYFGPFHVSAKLALRFQFPRAQGIIAISSYLADYYRSRGCPVVCVPPTVDTQQLKPPSVAPTDSPLTLVYAGTPGKKDLLANVIRGTQLVDPDGRRVRLILVGINDKQVKKLLGDAELPKFMLALGRLPQHDVANVVASGDFSVLLRPPERFAQAGFPTKFVESFVAGTPVIGNLTSDLAAHLIDGQTGLVCSNHSAEAYAMTLRRALLLTPDQRLALRHASRAHAEHFFDYRNYSESLKLFLGEVNACGR